MSTDEPIFRQHTGRRQTILTGRKVRVEFSQAACDLRVDGPYPHPRHRVASIPADRVARLCRPGKACSVATRWVRHPKPLRRPRHNPRCAAVLAWPHAQPCDCAAAYSISSRAVRRWSLGLGDAGVRPLTRQVEAVSRTGEPAIPAAPLAAHDSRHFSWSRRPPTRADPFPKKDRNKKVRRW
jgi:hypothetical protein